MIREAGAWAVYRLDLRARFDRRTTEVVPGTGIADVTSIKPVACFVTEDGSRLLAPGPGGHEQSHEQEGPLPDDVADPFDAWREVHGCGMSDLEGADFVCAFEAAMQDQALFALRASEAEVRRKQGETARGLGVAGGVSLGEMAAIRLAAGKLAELDEKIGTAERDSRGTPAVGLAADPSSSPLALAVHGADRARAAEEGGRRLEDLRLRREEVLAAQPMLRRVDSRRFAALGDEAMLAELGGDCGQILDDIAATRENLLAGRLALWSVEPIVSSAAAGLGVADREKLALIEAETQAAKSGSAITSIALAALSLGLGLAALAAGPLGAPAWAVAAMTAGAAGVGVADAVASTQDWMERRAAANTDMDPEQALIPDDLSGEWAVLVLAWIGIALDAGDVAAAVRVVRVGQRTVGEAAGDLARATGRSEDDLRDAARARGFDPEEGADVAQVRELEAAQVAAAAGRREEVERGIAGRAPGDVRGEPSFAENYVVRGDGVIARRPGRVQDGWPKLAVQDGTIRVVPEVSAPRAARIPADPGPGGLAGWLSEESPAFARYREVVASRLGKGEAEIEETLRDLASRPGMRDADKLRHAFHVATRDELLDWTLDGGDAAEAHRRLLGVCDELPNSYRGPFAERWYRIWRRVFGDGAELEIHPAALADGKNPALPGRRQPDNLHVAGREAGEVKSTARGMETPDFEQTEDLLNAIDRQGRLTLTRKGGGTVEVERYRLTFTNPKGAADPRTARRLAEWLEKYKFLTVEVIVDGKPRIFRQADAENLVSTLAGLVD